MDKPWDVGKHTPEWVLKYRCVECGCVGPKDDDLGNWMGGPLSGGGFLVTHWCKPTKPGLPFENGWNPAIPVRKGEE